MARQEVTLQHVIVNPDGSIEVGFDWNGIAGAQVYADEAAMRAANADLLTEPSEALRWLMFYLLALTGPDAATLQAQIGRKLVLDVGPAVQQNIALV